MKKSTVIWLITAALLVLVGCMVLGGVMAVLGWDFSKLATVRYETNQHEINGKFRNILVETDTADVTFVWSEDGICRVECYEESKGKHTVAVQDDTLMVKRVDDKAWYDYIGINFGLPKITVYLPNAEYASLCVHNSTGRVEVAKLLHFKTADISLTTGHVDFSAAASNAVKIKTSTGAIHVSDTTAEALELTASTGQITVSDVTCGGHVHTAVTTGRTRISGLACQNLTSSGNTGDMMLYNVLASGKLSLVRTTGDVSFEACDAAELFIKTDTGDVTGSLLSDKVFITQTDTGDVDVPKTVTGGRCEISTDTGDIQITVQ